MKPFDFDKANNGAPVCTIEGKDVLILTTARKHPTHRIVALLYNEVIDQDEIKTYNDTGHYFNDGVGSRIDLMMKD